MLHIVKLSILCVVLLMGSAAACRSTRSGSTPGDYRQDQATRQTRRDDRDLERPARQPLEQEGLEGQDVIDQPR